MNPTILAVLALAAPPSQLPSDTPEKFVPVTTAFDHVRREEMVPMRDGAKLKTIILVPKSAHGDAPILLDRTPYDAGNRTSGADSPHLAAIVPRMLDTAVEAGYIVVYQDVRGKGESEGDYVMTRPLRGPLNPTDVDHATDAYDTIDWLVKHVPESNGRVATIGGSYEGFTTVLSTVNPHPALKAAVPFAPMIDGWIGDDWFHNGAFREEMLEYTYTQEATRKSKEKWWSGARDNYDTYLRAGSAGAIAASRGLEQLGFWRAVSTHPAYDAYWQEQALDKRLAREPVTVPMLIVAGLFDQEDIYGGPALYAALAPKDPHGEKVHLVLGPWNHGGARRDMRSLGAVFFEGDTGAWFRRHVMQPFLDHHLKDAPDPHTARVLAYETGADEWHRYDDWPRACAKGCATASRKLYLRANGALSFDAPSEKAAAFDEYVSDPAKPVPYRARPNLESGAEGSGWGEWLVDDQRHAATRPDVLVWTSEPLEKPLRLAGAPFAELFASTSGTDSDWVVKVIDVWPDEVPAHPALGGYQQLLAADIFRGRYREDFAVPRALKPNAPLAYRIRLPNASHTFLRGHRIMVQVQSTWFPLYDRNPQTFVPNIFFAKSAEFVKATQRVFRDAAHPSAIELPVID